MMKIFRTCWTVCTLTVLVSAGWVRAEAIPELKVHLAQANNDSPYAFVRAKFEPGEIADPWAVRFFDEKDAEIPYFVWDSITWQVAHEGRADWGHRYALLNHSAGNAPEVLEARARKLHWAKQNLPELGAKLQAREDAAARSGNSVCAALYLLRHATPAYGKERLTLRVYPNRQVEPKRQTWKGEKVTQRVAVEQGQFSFQELPDQTKVTWKGKELFRYAGFNAGGTAATQGHVDPARPFAAEATEGIITKLYITGQTQGRNGGSMDWQCTYWLFPEGCYSALEGFNVSDTKGYIGGEQKLSIWEGEFSEVRRPAFEAPWWLHQVGQRGFVATHVFNSTPLTIGYGNNPFTVNSEGERKVARVDLDANRLALRWYCGLDDGATSRLLAPELYYRGCYQYARGEESRHWFDTNNSAVLTGTVADPPAWMTPEVKSYVEQQLKLLVRWQPKTDWLYRQYLVGVGEQAETAETAIRGVLGAAAGWIDRPVEAEELASLLVHIFRNLTLDAPLKWSKEMQTVHQVLTSNAPDLKKAVAASENQVAKTDKNIGQIQKRMAAGGNAVGGDSVRVSGGQGWIDNPSYHATGIHCCIHFFDLLGLPYPRDEYSRAALRFADFTLDILRGTPPDPKKLDAALHSHWPSRFAAIIPLMLQAYEIKPDANYARAATMMFDLLMKQVERNPQGYWTAWSAYPQKAEFFDTVYNMAGYQRGIGAFWADGMLDLIGRDRAAHFVAAQARYVAFSGQLLDSFEMDNTTAVYGRTHGGHPQQRDQFPLFFYDDYKFYRGLYADLIRWSAATECRAGWHGDFGGSCADRTISTVHYGAYALRWALDHMPKSTMHKEQP